jgi:cell division protein FtsB
MGGFMTGKRFEINNDMNLDSKVETYELSCIVDNSNKTFYFVVDGIANVESFVERLNRLHEENKALKHQLQQQELEYATTCHRLAEENESLKEENKFLRNKVATYKSGNALLKSTMDKEWK